MSKESALYKKGRQAQIIYEDLLKRFSVQPIPTTFVADDRRKVQFQKECVKANPYPFPINIKVRKERQEAIRLLFDEETIVQTPAIAAALAVCSTLATQIGGLRGDDISGSETVCDLAFAGVQALRVYMMDYDNKEFSKIRSASSTRVKGAFDGTVETGKYRTRDGKFVSFHVYYQSQQKKLVKALGLTKPSEKFTVFSKKKDMTQIAEKVAQFDAAALEELAFDCGATGCMLRTRQEWESTLVGNAVGAHFQRSRYTDTGLGSAKLERSAVRREGIGSDPYYCRTSVLPPVGRIRRKCTSCPSRQVH